MWKVTIDFVFRGDIIQSFSFPPQSEPDAYRLLTEVKLAYIDVPGFDIGLVECV